MNKYFTKEETQIAYKHIKKLPNFFFLYGGSQARGLIRAIATCLHQSHSNASATHTVAHGNTGSLTH